MHNGIETEAGETGMPMRRMTIADKKELEAYLPLLKAAEAIAVAVHADGTDVHGDPAVSVRLATEGCLELLIDCVSFLPSGLDILQQVFSAPAVKVFADAASELPFLNALGLTLQGPLFDVAIVSRLLGIAAA